jgi:hypothetical protein
LVQLDRQVYVWKFGWTPCTFILSWKAMGMG